MERRINLDNAVLYDSDDTLIRTPRVMHRQTNIKNKVNNILPKRPGLKPLTGGNSHPTTIDLTNYVSKFKMPCKDPNYMGPTTSNDKENLPVPKPRLQQKGLKLKEPKIHKMDMTTIFSPIQRACGPDVIDFTMVPSP